MIPYKNVLSLSLILIPGLCFSQRISEGSGKDSDQIKKSVTAKYETTPVQQKNDEDAADDPAIWYNEKHPKRSTIIGTDKKGGLAVYNLKGKQLFYYPDGAMNNVDLRYDFILGKDTIDIACASNRTSNSISIYSIQEDGSLKNIAARTIASDMNDEVYGFAMYKSPETKKIFAFVNSKAGEVEQWELLPNTDSTLVDAQKVRNFNLGTQTEGMVADDENQVIFIGEEVAGIWKFDAEPNGNNTGTLLSKSSSEENENIAYDIEGLAIYYLPAGDGYLLASSQGNYSYAVFERKSPHNYLGSFKIADGKIDGVEETDGIEIYSYKLNNKFKHGLLVVQDGYNFDKKNPLPQNFKLISWDKVAKIFSPPLQQN